MTDISDDVVKKAATGDMASFEQIYKSFSGFVYNVALRIVSDPADAEEIVQDVFLILHRRLKTFRFESSLKTWIYRITVNGAMAAARKNAAKRQKTVSYDDTLAVAREDDSKNSEHEARVILGLLEKINPEQRMCVVLRTIEGLSYQEIADALRINIGTVRSRLKRAREMMLALRKQVHHAQM